MKRMLIAAILLPFCCVAQVEDGAGESGGVHFVEGIKWQQVRQRAMAEHKFIFVDCFATWCGPCKAMDKNVYTIDSIANFANQHFISIKVQCDTTKADDVTVRERYEDAHQMIVKYGVHAYPTFLFFTPDGKIAHENIGYMDSRDFKSLLKEAMDSGKQYFTLMEEFWKGTISHGQMSYLAKFAKRLGDTALFSAIGRKYLYYLEQSGESDFRKEANLQFVADFATCINSGNKVFGWILNHEGEVDSIMKKKKLASDIIDNVIYREEVASVIAEAKKTGITPDWNLIINSIRKYGPAHQDPLYKGEMRWYEFKKDSENLCSAAIARLEACGYDKNPSDLNNQKILNEFAWQMFLQSKDPTKLEKALSWVNSFIGLIPDNKELLSRTLDTKANLLYKLGRQEEALPIETRAAELWPTQKAIAKDLQMMKEGLPTW